MKSFKSFITEEALDEVAAWQRKEGKSESGGLNRKGIESYRRENPGSKLSMAVTTKPSKLKAIGQSVTAEPAATEVAPKAATEVAPKV